MTVAAVQTYDSLVADISSYLERTDAATLQKIPTFIMLAEQIIATDLKFLGNLNVVQSNMVASQDVLDKPARWRKTVSMNITVDGQRQPVLLRDYEYLREYWPDPTQTGTPLYYSDYDYTHWLIAPTPDTNYTFEVLYYQRVPPLSSANQTNWFTEYAPQAMLYGSLLQAMPFLKNDERVQLWQAMYQQAIEMLKLENVARIGDRQAIVRDAS
jgi:hypothetical protein